jgi:hypothetical protein
MDKRQLVTYCGMYCSLCVHRTRIPNHARELVQVLKEAKYDKRAAGIPEFKDFWTFVNGLANVPDDRCCKLGGCGHSTCAIRKCAQSKGVETCDCCSDFPCEKVNAIAKYYPTLVFDGHRRKQVGMDAWINEQERRLKAGFQYADITCRADEAPSA